MSARTEVEVDGHAVSLSNLDKVLYPAAGFTKGQVIDYYARIAPVMLPHVTGRQLTRKRYPNGVEEEFFFEKNCPRHAPEWVTTAAIWSGSSKRDIEFCVADSTATLVWLANLAALELHPQLHLADDPDRPTVVAFDLDPGAPADIVQCCEVALLLRGLLDTLGLQAFPKVSGSKGMQVYVPLNTAEVTYDHTKGFALAAAQLLEKDHPDLIVSNMAKELRTGKVFIDWSQNDQHKTTVAVYSLRARERPWVSLPVTWEEVEAADRAALRFEARDALERVSARGDLFRPVLDLEQALPRFG